MSAPQTLASLLPCGATLGLSSGAGQRGTRSRSLAASVTIDMDSTDVVVYGSRKQGVAYNYAGRRAGRPHLATWAEAGATAAAELGGNDQRP